LLEFFWNVGEGLSKHAVWYSASFPRSRENRLMSRKIVSFFAVAAMLVLPAVVSAQCSNCGTSSPVYSTPISGGVVYSGGMVYTSYQPAAIQSGCSGCTSCVTSCNPCCPAPTTCCSTQRTRRVSIFNRRGRNRSNCCSTPVNTCCNNSYVRTPRRSSCCNTSCNTCCNTGCGGCVQQTSCSSCGGGCTGCAGCATASSSGVIMGNMAAPVEPQAVTSPSDVVVPPVPQEDKVK